MLFECITQKIIIITAPEHNSAIAPPLDPFSKEIAIDKQRLIKTSLSHFFLNIYSLATK